MNDETLKRTDTKKKRHKGYTDVSQFGILNPWGDIWGAKTFGTPEAADAYLTNFWRGTKDINLEEFRIVKVRVHVTVLVSKNEEQTK